ncbi:MAG: pyridoxal-5-phosphate-dependent protein subunit beta, partial [Actinomycetota bacterium]
VRNTDIAMGIDDEASVSLIRLFNEPAGREYLASRGVSDDLIEKLPLLGISGVGNLLMAIKFAKYYELTGSDVVVTVGTDSMEMYQSRLAEMTTERGEFSELDAAGTYAQHLMGQGIDHMQELGYYDRKRIHNLKYYTWVEQQGKTYDEIQAQWYDPEYWTSIQAMGGPIDDMIDAFNARVVD